MSDISIYGQPITQVNSFKYLSFHLRAGIIWACRLKCYAFDRLTQENQHFTGLNHTIARWALVAKAFAASW